MLTKTPKQTFKLGQVVTTGLHPQWGFVITGITLSDGVIRYNGERNAHIKYTAEELAATTISARIRVI